MTTKSRNRFKRKIQDEISRLLSLKDPTEYEELRSLFYVYAGIIKSAEQEGINRKTISKLQNKQQQLVKDIIIKISAINVPKEYEELKSLSFEYNNTIMMAVQVGIDRNMILKLREKQQQLVKDMLKHSEPVESSSIVESEDNEEVFNRISDSVGSIRKNVSDADELIQKLDLKYRNTPEFKKIITNLIKRPSSLSDAIKAKHGFKCMICGYPGFIKKDGEMYAEVHHMIELNEQAPKTLQSWNLLVICPLCHKKLHYADVESEFLDPGWKINVDGQEYIIK